MASGLERVAVRVGMTIFQHARLRFTEAHNGRHGGYYANRREGRYNSGMIDIDAQIVAGKSAAGFSIGGLVSELLGAVRPRSTTKLSSGEKHDLGAIKVWAKEGVITQIGVYSGYRGVLEPDIRIGSTIADVEDSFGFSVQDDEEDNLVVPDSPGWCFETEEWGTPRPSINETLGFCRSLSSALIDVQPASLAKTAHLTF